MSRQRPAQFDFEHPWHGPRAADTGAAVARRVLLGRTGLQVSPICIGTAAWGISSPDHGIVVAEEDAIATVRAAVASPINYIDTSNNYGGGESERRIGLALAELGGVGGVILQTKLDRDPETNSFDQSRMRRSLDESLARLGVDNLPLLFLHDPEHIGFEEAMRPGGPVDALTELRDEGYAAHIGISGGPASLLHRFVDTGVFDALITHNRFSLVDRTADALITAAARAGLGILNAAVYGGGILAQWPRRTDRYHYATASPAVLGAIDAMGRACERHDVALAAAALQFSLRDARIHSTVCGIVSPAQLEETVMLAEMAIPDALWEELESLVPTREHWIGD